MPKNESYYTQKWIRHMREHHPDWTVFKHADAFTAGTPDISVSFNQRTTWVEDKWVPFKPMEIQLWRVLTPGLQMFNMSRLAKVTSAFYMVVAKDYPTTKAPVLWIRGDHMLDHVRHETTLKPDMSLWSNWKPEWIYGRPIMFEDFNVEGLTSILRLIHRRRDGE